MLAHKRFQRLVERFRHRQRVAMRDRGFDAHTEIQSVRLADTINRHQKCLVFQGHFGGRKRCARGLAHEIQKLSVLHVVIGDQPDHAALAQEA